MQESLFENPLLLMQQQNTSIPIKGKQLNCSANCHNQGLSYSSDRYLLNRFNGYESNNFKLLFNYFSVLFKIFIYL